MVEDKSVHGYFGLREEGKTQGSGFCYRPDLASVRDWLENPKKREPSEGAMHSTETAGAKSRPLSDAMTRFIDVTHGQGELVLLASVMSPVMTEMITQEEVFKPVISKGSFIEKTEGGSIYAMHQSPLDWLIPASEKLDRSAIGFSVLPNAVFLGIVATFDSNVSDAVRAMLAIRSDRLHATGRAVPLSDIIKASSIDELISRAIDEEIYLFSRGSHEEQVKYIETHFSIEIQRHWKRWPDFIEIFERRNLIAHGERLFTKRYVDICSKANHKGSSSLLGESVKLRTSYLHQALDILLEFYVLLVFTFWRKHVPDEEGDAFRAISDIVYTLIENKRYRVAVRIGEFAISLKTEALQESIRRRIVINLASSHHHLDDEAACLKVLDSMDWTACSENYQICVAALRNDLSSVSELMPKVIASGTVSKDEFRSWPVFDHIRAHPDFRAAYEQNFGESLLIPTQEATDEPVHSAPSSAEDEAH